jgi:hypothetical protein
LQQMIVGLQLWSSIVGGCRRLWFRLNLISPTCLLKTVRFSGRKIPSKRHQIRNEPYGNWLRNSWAIETNLSSCWDLGWQKNILLFGLWLCRFGQASK